ncbi:L-rhamnose mutarotase [Paenibacillus hamazuiensis]|uniref:L-rhamnose mutarotase n=1 Tax=Paenibacillus hamazuiensis TaxID=2936508 RepID=UPI00200CEA34|nr:L-rhamnose mutarotase [Paenibacillus hamazuiensis]
MQHISFVLKIDPADFGAYKERHEHVYPELERRFGEVGIHSYHIFYHEGTLFAYMLVEDFDAAMAQLQNDPANVKWQQFMSDMLKAWEDGNMIKMIPRMYSYEK